MGVKQFQRPRLNAGQRPLIRIRKLTFDSCGCHCVAVAGSAFIRFRQELLQQPFNAKNRGQNPARNVIPVKRQWVRITRISLW
mgnify:CR=1 FL=1